MFQSSDNSREYTLFNDGSTYNGEKKHLEVDINEGDEVVANELNEYGWLVISNDNLEPTSSQSQNTWDARGGEKCRYSEKRRPLIIKGRNDNLYFSIVVIIIVVLLYFVFCYSSVYTL